MKIIYTFNVNKEIEKEENGVKTKDFAYILFGIRKPSRSEREEAELVRAEYLSKYIRRGVMPEAVLNKNYSDQGGTMDEFEKALQLNLQIKLFEKTEEFKKLTVEKANKDIIENKLKEILDIRQELNSFQYKQNSYFENTAEFKAKTKLIEYLFTSLVVFKEKDTDDWKQYFTKENLEDNLDYIDSLEENKDQVYLKMKDKALFTISLFVHLGGNITTEDIEKTIKENFAE